MESVYASQLVVGDKLVRKKEEVLVEEEVLAVEEVVDSGYWAPLTEEGTLLVDGFLPQGVYPQAVFLVPGFESPPTACKRRAL